MTRRSTDFSAYFVAKWTDGQMPTAHGRRAKVIEGNTVVRHDETNHAYDIAADDMADFLDWVANTWETDHMPQCYCEEAEDNWVAETTQDYLDRCGISIRQV
jgi:hypothetical protein